MFCVTHFRAERTDRFKSERFAEDSSVLTTSSRRNDRDFRSDKMGRSRESRRPGGRREQRYDHYTEDYDMNKVAERFSNPTYVPKDGRYFLVSACKLNLMLQTLHEFHVMDSTMTEKWQLQDVATCSGHAVH